MRSGVSFPSYTNLMSLVQITGAWSASFPLANLADLKNIRALARASAAGPRAFNFNLSSPSQVQMVALIHHNGRPTSTVRLRLYSAADAGGTLLFDSGVVLLWPAGSAQGYFPGVRPIILDSPVAAASGSISLGGEGGEVIELGGLEVAGFWEWKDVAVPRELGLNNRDVVIGKPMGYDEAMMQWSPRTMVGSREVVLQTENETTGVDFQREKKTSRPFVWLWDYADPTTWANEVMLVTNSSLPPGVAHSFPAGRQPFAFQEHIG